MRKKMFITNKKLKRTTYYLLILILMLINVDVCYAKLYSEEFAFKIDEFGNNPSFDRMMETIDAKIVPENVYKYALYDKDSNTWREGVFYTQEDQSVRKKYTKIAFYGNTSQEVYSTLMDNGIWADIKTSYCKYNTSTANNRPTNISTEAKELCDKLMDTIDESNTDSPSKKCDYNFKVESEGKNYGFYFNWYEGTDGLGVTSSEPNLNITSNNQEATIGRTKIYFHEKGGTFAEFRKDFHEAYDAKNGCPEIHFYNAPSSERYDRWYATLNKENCESYANEGCQSTSGGITNDFDNFDAPDFDDLIGEENIVAVCSDLLKEGGALQTTLKWLVRLIKILIPIALIGLGIVDFAKATFSGNEDSMKKSTSKFIKRLIIAVIIFLIPTVLELILKIASGIWPELSSDFCGIL